MGDRVVWRAIVHGADGRWQRAEMTRRADGLLRLDVGPDGDWPKESATLDRDDARSLFAALGDALQADR